MKKNERTLSVVLLCAALAIAVFTALTYYRSLMISFDTSIGHFDPGIGTTAFMIGAPAAVLFAIASGVALSRKCTVDPDRKYSKALIAAFVILGALILAKSFISIPEAFSQAAQASKTVDGIQKDEIVALLTPIFGVAAAIYFIIAAGEKKTEKARSYLSFAAIIWTLLCTLSVYFDSGRTINSPLKAIMLCIAVANMLFVTEDARFLIGTQKAAALRAFCGICACMGVAFALPNAICAVLASCSVEKSMLFDSPNGIYSILTFDLLYSLIYLAIPVCALIRLITSGNYLGEYSAPKHEKKAATPFGEAPSESTASEESGDSKDADDKNCAKAKEKEKETEADDGEASSKDAPAAEEPESDDKPVSDDGDKPADDGPKE